jgi:glycosyltransferase involved in cell wall biosynthesis
MKVALCSTILPFVFGGARFIVEWLEERLREHGHQVERIYLPFDEDPETMLTQMTAFRLIDLSDSVDRLIAFRPPSYLLAHPNKVLWFIHHFRGYYDFWDSPYQPMPDNPRNRALRECVMAADQVGLGEARRIFTNSKIVSNRLRRFNGLESEVLYPPIDRPERFHCVDYGDEIVYVCRLEHHKRQHLLIEAMRHVQTPVRLRLCGTGEDRPYIAGLGRMIAEFGIQDRVKLEDRWISEDEKVNLLSGALATAYVAFDEDSYGYPSLEASHASKPILTTTDSGGVLELVTDGVNGFVRDPEPAALADAMDRLYLDRAMARRLGQGARDRVQELKINWDHVVERILA